MGSVLWTRALRQGDLGRRVATLQVVCESMFAYRPAPVGRRPQEPRWRGSGLPLCRLGDKE
eukprot:10255894-Alexandrium_andersonii.AAC.1